MTFQANRGLEPLGVGPDAWVTVDTSGFRRFLLSNLTAIWKLRKTNFDLVLNLEFFATYAAPVTSLLRKRFAMAFGGFALYRNSFFHDFVSYDSAPHVQQKFLNFARALATMAPLRR